MTCKSLVALAFLGSFYVVGCGSGGSSNPPNPPTANAGGPYTGTVGTAVAFNGSGSTDPQGQTLTYSWSFGDNTTGTGVSPTHTYSAPGAYTVSLTVTDTSNLSATATTKATIPNGSVKAGQKPLSGAHVYLFAANTTGYGQPSVSLLSEASTGTSDSVGAYVLTDSDGSFVFAGDYTCTAGAQVYLYALGGNSGNGDNSASGLLAALGNCPTAGNFEAVPYIQVNEISTVAATYAFAGFATDATHVSSSGSALAAMGVANAFATAMNLETLSTGQALATTPAGNGTVPQNEIDTLANILDACVGSAGPASNACTTLFSNAMDGSNTPTDTASAVLNIAHNPGANVGNLFSLQDGSPSFVPDLNSAPNDFTLAITFTGGGLNVPDKAAVDSVGDVWVANTVGDALSEFSPNGKPLSGTGFTGGGLPQGVGSTAAIAIDASDNVWVADTLPVVSEFSHNGTPLSGSGYTGGGIDSPNGIAVDKSGNIWITNYAGNSLSELSPAGVANGSSPFFGGGLYHPQGVVADTSGDLWIANSSGTTKTPELSEFTASSGAPNPNSPFMGGGGGTTLAQDIAVDASGDIWLTNSNGPSLNEFNSSGGAISGAGGYTGGGLHSPTAVAIDGAGNVWVADYSGSISEFSSSGTAISGQSGHGFGYTGSGSSWAGDFDSLAIDPSGNVWVPNFKSPGDALLEFVGAATPVVTPIVANLLSPYGSKAVNKP